MPKVNSAHELHGAYAALPPSADPKSGRYDPYAALASAIVEKACDDLYSTYRRKLKSDRTLALYAGLMRQVTERNLKEIEVGERVSDERYVRTTYSTAVKKNAELSKSMDELTGFFFGDWIAMLTDLDGPALYDEILGEVERTAKLFDGKGGEL